jgi:hypothetical protein
VVFHQLDMIDSRMGGFDELKTTGEFTRFKGETFWAVPQRLLPEATEVVDLPPMEVL